MCPRPLSWPLPSSSFFQFPQSPLRFPGFHSGGEGPRNGSSHDLGPVLSAAPVAFIPQREGDVRASGPRFHIGPPKSCVRPRESSQGKMNAFGDFSGRPSPLISLLPISGHSSPACCRPLNLFCGRQPGGRRSRMFFPHCGITLPQQLTLRDVCYQWTVCGGRQSGRKVPNRCLKSLGSAPGVSQS